MKLKTTIIATALAISLAPVTNVTADGNRYYFDRYYTSEISPAKTFLEMHSGAIVIDVRRLREYYAGHPYAENAPVGYQHAYNVPYPHIDDNNNNQDPQEFYDQVVEAVERATGMDRDDPEFYDTPIRTLCRTGARSVRAANILADLEDPLHNNPPQPGDATVIGTPFTDVRNIWEGFVGQYKEAYLRPLTGLEEIDSSGLEASTPPKKIGQTSLVGPGKKGLVNSLFELGSSLEEQNEILIAHEEQHHLYLDLDNMNGLDTDEADIIEETTDKNPDKDGWRNYQELPWAIWSDDLATDGYAYPPGVESGGYDGFNVVIP